MATLFGKNYTKGYINVPSEMANVGEIHGVKRVVYDEADGAIAADTLTFGKIPAGAKLLEVKSIGAGAGASFDVVPGTSITAETNVVLTIGTAPSATVKAWVEYVLD